MKNICFCFVLLGVFGGSSCFAIDLDDDIAIDDSIEEYHDMGKIQQNNKYIILSAMTKANMASGLDSLENSSSAINSVILTPGAEVHGDIIIVDESEGGHTAIAK